MRAPFLVIVALLLGACSGVVHALEAPYVEPSLDRMPPGSISGVIGDANTYERMEGAVVVLQSEARPGELHETLTDELGRYGFTALPPDTYVVQVLYGQADVSRFAELPADARVRADLTLDPDFQYLHLRPIRPPLDRSSFSTSQEEAHLLGIPVTLYSY